jgi:sugar/nucleoside kinase (ribokinase family)
MLNSQEFRRTAADRLDAAASRVPELSAFVGLDGFVDEILHVVDKRYDADRFDRVPTIAAYAERLAAAAGRSTNVELVNVMTKLGGNGPIMANALASFGLRVSYLGALGYPAIHPVFESFTRRADVASVCGAGLTDALEFEDGKIMVGKHYTLKEVNWANICSRYGKDRFALKFASADLVGFVNWTMLPYMSDIWAAIQSDLLPGLLGERRKIFFDLADPEKRTPADIQRALDLIVRFQSRFDVILGLNEKEAYEIARVLGLDPSPRDAQGLAQLAIDIQKRVAVETLVVHPVAYALTVSNGKADLVEGSVCRKPTITTGAGDHFNSGFCLGRLLGLSNADSLLCGVSTSGHYVRSAESPRVADLSRFMRNWPTE